MDVLLCTHPGLYGGICISCGETPSERAETMEIEVKFTQGKLVEEECTASSQ